MTERLSTLLRETADQVVVPPPPTGAILRSARRASRKRRAVRTLAAVAAVGVIASGIGATIGLGRGADSAQDRFESAPAAQAYDDYGAFSVGSTVYVGNHRVRFDQKIKSIYYTSEGVLVRRGRVASTDDDAPSIYTLISPNGSTRNIDLPIGNRFPATDPDSPEVGYLEPAGERWAFVVVDLRTGDEVARTVVAGRFTWAGWEAPPATMSGERIWGLFDEGWVELDWKTGRTRLIPNTKGASLDAAHGRFAMHHGVGTPWSIRDFSTGQEVRTIRLTMPASGNPLRTDVGFFSPDGRYVRVQDGFLSYNEDDQVIDPPRSHVVSLETGRIVQLPGREQFGWTPDGKVIAVDPKRDRIKVCDPSDGRCELIELEIGSGMVKVGGMSYES